MMMIIILVMKNDDNINDESNDSISGIDACFEEIDVNDDDDGSGDSDGNNNID